MRRLFTLQRVRKVLPHVRKLTSEIAGLSKKAAKVDGAERRTLLRTAAELVGKLEDIGCELKSSELGLVDFPALRGGHPVYLCWRLGEETVSFWHSPSDGFGGRKALDESDFLGELEPISLNDGLVSILVRLFERYGKEDQILASNVSARVLRASQIGESILPLDERDIKIILSMVNRFINECQEVEVKETLRLREILIETLL